MTLLKLGILRDFFVGFATAVFAFALSGALFAGVGGWGDVAAYSLSAGLVAVLCFGLLYGGDNEYPVRDARRALEMAGAAVLALAINWMILGMLGLASRTSALVPLLHMPLLAGAMLASRHFATRIRSLVSGLVAGADNHRYFLYDFLVLVASPYIALFIRYDYSLAWDKAMAISAYALIVVAIAVPVVLASNTHRTSWHHFTLADLPRIVWAALTTIVVALVLDFSLSRLEYVPRSLPLIQLAFAIAAMAAGRLVVRHRHRSQTASVACPFQPDHREHVIVVGMNHVAELYLNSAQLLGRATIHVAGLLDDNPANRGKMLCNRKVLGSPVELPEQLAKLKVHGIEVTRVVVATKFADLSAKSQEVLHHWERSGAVTLDLFEERLGFAPKPVVHQSEVTTFGSDAIRLLQETGNLNPGFGGQNYAPLKRFIDIVGALTLMIVLAPLIALAALLVAIDLGTPVIFWQERPGLRGVPFRLYKFRTMRSKRDVSYGDRDANNKADEQRITTVGRLLRRTRMDELPQLYHVLVGEMSFVGPRPLLRAYQPEDGRVRLLVRPGVTGWAQVHGGDKLSAQEKLALDMQYLNHMSLGMDIEIVWRTIKVAVKGDAYDAAAIDQAMREFETLRQNVDDERRRRDLAA